MDALLKLFEVTDTSLVGQLEPTRLENLAWHFLALRGLRKLEAHLRDFVAHILRVPTSKKSTIGQLLRALYIVIMRDVLGRKSAFHTGHLILGMRMVEFSKLIQVWTPISRRHLKLLTDPALLMEVHIDMLGGLGEAGVEVTRNLALRLVSTTGTAVPVAVAAARTIVQGSNSNVSNLKTSMWLSWVQDEQAKKLVSNHFVSCP